MTTDRAVRKAVLLAAGRGKRLGALTADQPKPMVPVLGRPALEWILGGLVQTGLDDILMVVGYRAEAISAHFGDGSRWGACVSYAFQEEPSGTGAALAMARSFAGGGPVLASYGDILTDPSHYRSLVADYDATHAAAVIGINPMDDPSAGAAVYRDGDRVVRVVEKPPPGEALSRWNVAGVSVYGAAVWPVLDALKRSPRGEYELTDAITALIADGADVRAREFDGFWSDIGTPETLAEAERAWLEHGPGATRARQ